MSKINIVVAEGHIVFRAGFVSLLQIDEHFHTVGEASNTNELLKLLDKKDVDIVLLDTKLPGMGGMETLKKIQELYPKVKVIMLSLREDAPLSPQYIAAGARAMLHKKFRLETLIQAIYSVHADGFFADQDHFREMANSLVMEHKRQQQIEYTSLTPRELEILQKICDGKTNRDLAKELDISISTVDFHRQNIYRKTQTNSIVELVKYAIRYGIILV